MTYFKTRLQEYLDQYPQFLDKSPDSNFTRQTMVYNKQRKELLQQCNNLRLSQDLNRPLQIQKIQNQPGLAVFNFYVYIENIKEVKIEQYNKENTMTVLVDETFTKENVNNYSYSTTLTSTSEIIPYSNFKLIVDTYDEYHYEKGYPENNIIQGNEYDHDTALDKLGKLLGVERYKHIEVGESSLYKTLPSYFDGATEDDYYYQERIKEYVSRFGVTSLPQLDFWKRFGYDTEMYNRKRLLTSQGGVEDIDSWVYDKDTGLYYCFVDCDSIDKVVDTENSLLPDTVRYGLQGIVDCTVYPKDAIHVTCSVDKTTVSSGSTVTFTGNVLDEQGSGVTGLTVYLFNDEHVKVAEAVTGSDGVVSISHVCNGDGDFGFYLSVDGGDSYFGGVSNTVVVSVKVKKDSSLSISLSSSSVSLGESVTVTGTLTGEDGSAISGATVSLMVGSVDSSITNYATISTDITNNDGTCTFTYTPSVAGTMPLYLQFEATTVYNGCSSSVVNLTVLNPTLFEDACNSNSGLSNYGTLVTIESAGTSASLEYDSTMNAYKLTSLSNGVKIYPITELNGKSNLSLEMEVYMPSDTYTETSLGFGVAVPETSGYSEVGFVLVHEHNGIYRHHFVSGSFRGNTTIGTDIFDTWYKIKTVFNGTNTTTTVTNMSTNEVVVNNSTYDLTTLSSTFSDISKYVYGIDIAWSNGAYGYVRNIKAVRL